jgi:hypothetical protein
MQRLLIKTDGTAEGTSFEDADTGKDAVHQSPGPIAAAEARQRGAGVEVILNLSAGEVEVAVEKKTAKADKPDTDAKG